LITVENVATHAIFPTARQFASPDSAPSGHARLGTLIAIKNLLTDVRPPSWLISITVAPAATHVHIVPTVELSVRLGSAASNAIQDGRTAMAIPTMDVRQAWKTIPLIVAAVETLWVADGWNSEEFVNNGFQ